jgi:hypothetical protein
MVVTRYLRFNAGAEPRERQPSLERLLVGAGPGGVLTDWRGEVFAQLAPQAPVPAAGAVAAFGLADLDPAIRLICIASPVSYMAELSNVRMANDGVLGLQSDELRALSQDFNKVWADAGVQLRVREERLLACFEQALQVLTVDPASAAGRHLEAFLPSGRDGAVLRRLMSEMEMWLFEHPLNSARAARRAPPISGLWLWGAGPPLNVLPHAAIAAHGTDVLFGAYNVQDARRANLWITGAVPGSADWREVESEWLNPTLASLRRGEIERLTLSAGAHSVQIKRQGLWRFWRRAQPWWEFFE